jgi:hypothetical protein
MAMNDHDTRQPPMSAARWSALEPMVDRALDTPTHERLTYLRAACGNDSAMLQELLVLLQASDAPHDAVEAELNAGAAALVPTLLESVAPRTLNIPDVLAGRYRIVRELGQGGMAVVYLAEDLRLERRVAIKVLRRDIRLRRGGERFNAEIRLTANFRHPNIVPLFESGEADGWTFFVMPFIDGETLLHRLARVGAHEPSDAARIVIDIAAALSHAHRAGAVHRDVKPSNIMLADGQALLMDFGIARAARGEDEQFTQPGFAVGTPAYMSPEQCVGDAAAGPASDIYSLGGVLYELLAGQAPPAAAIRLAQASPAVTQRPVRRTIEPRLPAAMSSVIERAMRLVAAERFSSADEFAAAVSAAARADAPSAARGAPALATSASTGVHTPRWAWAAGLIMTAAAAALSFRTDWSLSAVRSRMFGAAGTVSGDTARILLLDATHASEAMRAAGITDSALSSGQASRVASSVNAGRYLRRDVAVRGTQTYLHAVLHETGSARVLGEATVNLGVGLDTAESAFRDVADQVLLPNVPSGLRSGAFVGTASRPALQHFARGVGAVDRWDLPAADSALAIASSHDSTFARAELWLAQVRVWQRRPDEAWTYLVTRAAARRATLVTRDQRALDALQAQASGETQRACALWGQLAQAEVNDFSAWYGAATCEIADNAVVRDARSASGWRYRSSHHHATVAFRRAFSLLPTALREFRTSWFAELEARLLTSPTQLRFGAAVKPDTGVFLAYPSWDVRGDSLTFVPYPMADFSLRRPWTYPASHREAVRQQREVMRQVAATWRAAYPASADAMLAVAISLDKLADPSAIDSLTVASRLAATEDERLRVGIARVWLLVRYGVPNDLVALRKARALADSLLRRDVRPTAATTEALASVAMLTGRVGLAVTLARGGSELVDRTVSVPLKRAATSLQILAASGAAVDSFARLEGDVSSGIAQSVAHGAQASARERLLGRAATLVFPRYRSPLLAELAGTGDDLALAQNASALGDTSASRGALRRLSDARAALPPEDLKFEALLPEAELLRAIGDNRAALALLEPTLDAQRAAEPGMRLPIGAAMLVRAIGVRAELEAAVGDRAEADRWSRAFLTLWGDGDALVRPQVRRVRSVSGN